ncbi:recombinase family protein [Micromonospora sp. WMMD1102]|uniref:recombinase family protein n=1 Tax=Micromonospora sp. WMMD1102 TaxID=3016105 RepID=UPI0024153669|nr:recombinase family protein [Micromonospora sp. WMMD1102]MDG4790390.1 recombinase family protein [Micromonospora sp. WMMD1102]MDG4792144.1 recombinase family protein [Micromonospora sp. WMMD1102]
MTTADFYGRKSNRDDGQSVAGQEAEFRDDCEDQGFDVGRIFADPDRSASRYARRPRPDFNELLTHIRSGNCQMLSMWESSRGSRDEVEWFTFLRDCRKQGVPIRIISHDRTYNLNVRRDWRTLADEGVDAADESAKISERTRRGKRIAAKQGKPVGRLAYGFARVYDERGKFLDQVADPAEAPVVREVIQRIAKGEPYRQIAMSLNDRQIAPPQRPCDPGCDRDHKHMKLGQWTDRQVRQLATHHSYAGLRVHQGKVIGKGVWKPLVDLQVWQRAYDRVTKSRGLHNDSRSRHWLTGAVRCSECNHTLRSVTRNNNGGYAYQCRNAECFKVSGSARGLEEVIEGMILAWLDRPSSRRIFQQDGDNTALRAAEAEEQRLRDHLNTFYSRAANPAAGLSAAGLAAIEAELLPQIDAAAAKVKRLSTPPTLVALADVDIVSEWANLGPLVRRDVVRAIADVVLVPGGRGAGPRFDRWRLAGSRYHGDEKTWGDHWKEQQ